jgi:hypothetical protein
MNAAQRGEVMRQLWPAGSRSPRGVWAILDGARDARVHLALLESRLEFLCLYSGKLPPTLEQKAPHLVQLLPGHRLTDRLLGDSWGESWGVLLTIDDASNLRHHLRKLLRVTVPGRRPLLFRFYDPRVLHAYLPTCTPDELAQVFGPIASFFVEGDGGGTLTEFALEAGRLRRTELPLADVVAAP